MYEIERLPQSIDIGYTGEMDFHTVQIDMSEWVAKMPEGQPTLMHIRPGEYDPYPVTITYENNIITWSVTDGDLGTSEGTGLLQVWFGVQDETEVMRQLGMSVVVPTIIHLSIAGEGRNSSTVQIPWLKEVMEMKNLILGYDYEAESWANGQRGGEDVGSDDRAYHNNAKYYKEQVEDMASDAEAYAAGTRGGEDVDEDDPAYENNAKYYNEQAALEKAAAQAAAETASAAYNVNLLAANYDATKTYAVGEYVIYSGGLYRCISAITTAEAWTAAHWSSVTVGKDTSALKSAIGDKIPIYNGSFVSSAWAANNYSMFVKVVPGSPYSITAGGTAAQFFGLKSATLPPTVGDTADYSAETGWTSSRTITKETTETGTIPKDVNVLYFYLGTSTAYSRMPTKIVLGGVDILGTAFETLKDTLNKEIERKKDVDRIDEQMYFTPFGFEPHQLSLFKPTANLFSDFCYHIINSYYTVQINADKHYPRVTNGTNWQGWLIRVKPSTSYAIGPVDFRVDFLKWDGTLDKRITTVSDEQSNVVESGSESCWMCLTQKLARDMSGWMMVEGTTYPSEYVSGYPKWVAVPTTENTDIKTIAFMGDSITAGVGVASAKAYHMYLHDRYGWTCLNYGYGGSGYYHSYPGSSAGRIGTGDPGIGVPTTSENYFVPNNVAARLAELDPTALDGIVIFAGTNDWGNNVSVENFISGIEAAFSYCKTNLTDIPVVVMTPVHRKNDTVVNTQGKTLSEYVDILLAECRKYSMAVVDCMTMTGLYPDNAANLAEFFATDSTGLHPSTEGHKRIASVVGGTIKEVIDCHNF